MNSRFSKHLLAALLMLGSQKMTADHAQHKSCNDCDSCTCDYRGCFCLANLESLKKSATINYTSDLSEVQNIIANNERVMVKFFLTGRCNSCEAGKLFIKLSKQSQDGTIFVAFSIAADDRESIFNEFGLQSLPTITLFVNGEQEKIVFPRAK